jgi:flagellar biosynthesis chaperone FliJ
MESKLVALFIIIALLAGLVGCYGLGYVVYQPQIQDVQNKESESSNRLDALNSTYQSALNNLTSTISYLTSEIAYLNSTLQNKESESSNRLDALNSTYQSALNNLTSTISYLTSEIAYLNSTLQNKESESSNRLDALNSTYQSALISLSIAVSDLKSEIARMNSALETLIALSSTPAYFEELKFTSAYATGPAGNPPRYTVIMTIQNTGWTIATWDPSNVFYNGKPASEYPSDNITCAFNQTTLYPGETATGTITMNSGTDFVSGMTVDIMIQTASGKEYPHVVVFR